MAKVFEDKDGNIGTMVVLKGNPQDYIPEGGIYHGELELPEDSEYRAAWKHENGAIVEDKVMLREIQKKRIEEEAIIRKEELKAEIQDAMLEEDDIEAIKARYIKLKALEQEKKDFIDSKQAVNTIKGAPVKIEKEELEE